VYRRDADSGCWPSRMQELLLQSSLLDDERARAAWAEWKSVVDIAHLDSGSYRLLPLLYRNLRNLRIDDELVGRLRGVHRRTWYQNQILFNATAPLLSDLARAGIQALVLKGGAIAVLHYGDCGLRPMSDFDVMVRPGHAQEAVDFVRSRGWTSASEAQERLLDAHLAYGHGHHFRTTEGHHLDLHWRLLDVAFPRDLDESLWRRAVRLRLRGADSLALCPSDQLFHVCVHGARWNPEPPVRWVADAATVLSTSGTNIDWNRVVSLATGCALTLPLYSALAYLKGLLDSPVPPEVLDTLGAFPVSDTERAEHRVFTHPPSWLGGLPRQWFAYLRCTPPGTPLKRWLSFPRYLKSRWGAQSTWDVAVLIVGKAIRRTSRRLGAYATDLWRAHTLQ
jgi:hypothetical protein